MPANAKFQKAAEALQQGDSNPFEQLVKGTVKPRGDAELSAVKQAVQTLAEKALEGVALIPGDAIKTIKSIIAEIDAKLSEQINLIIHHPEFQALESTWRGIRHLVFNTETDTMLKIRVLNVSKKDAAKELKRFPGTAWDQSSLFKKIYGAEYDVLGGSPYGCLVGDYHIDNTPEDIGFLSDMAKIAAAAHAPFLCAADPGMVRMESWQELSQPRDLAKIFDSPAHAQWAAFRKQEDAAYVALTMPRFLGRLPYGTKAKNPLEEFAFEEDTDGKDHSKFLWSNSAFAMAANITRSFKEYGWCTRIRGVESGGTVSELPCYTFPTDDGSTDMKCPTEIAIGDRRGAELDKLGFIPLYHRKGTTDATFIGAQSVFQPGKYFDPDAEANSNLTARLYYLFPVCRFAHYLKVMVRDKIGSFKERSDMESWLNNWISNYVLLNPDAGEEAKAQKPLAAAEVKVQEIPGNPGYYAAQFWLRPHYQLEGLNVSLRLTSKLPSAKAGG
jgi:type VI secretion system protein ImpC